MLTAELFVIAKRLGATQVSDRGGWLSELWTATQRRAGQLLKNGDVDVSSLKWQEAHSILSSSKAGYRGTRAQRDAILIFDLRQEERVSKWWPRGSGIMTN